MSRECSAIERFLARNEKQVLLLSFLLALTARVAVVFWLRNFLAPIGSEYEGIAINLLDGKGYSLAPFFGIGYFQRTSWAAPTYPFLLAFAFSLGGVYSHYSFLIVELAQVLLASATCLVIYGIASHLLGRVVGLVALLMVAVYPDFVYMPTQHRPITLIVFLLCCDVLCLLVLEKKPSTKWALITGIVTGLLTLTEPVTLAFVVLAFGWFLFVSTAAIGVKIKIVLSIAAVGFAIILPWTVRNYVVHGKLILVKSTFGYQLWSGNNPDATGTLRLQIPSNGDPGVHDSSRGIPADSETRLWKEKQRMPLIASKMPVALRSTLETLPEVRADGVLFDIAIKYILQNRRRFLELTVARIYYFWWFDPTNPLARSFIYRLPWIIVFPLSVAGMFLSQRQWKDLSLVYFLVIALTLPYIITVIEARFRMPIEPFVMVFAAYTVVTFCGFLLSVFRSLRGAALPNSF